MVEASSAAVPRRRASSRAPVSASLRVREFLALVEGLSVPLLPEGARTRIAFSFVQVIFDDPRIHYECWVQRRSAALEVGLHFEGVRDFSYAWAGLLAEHMADVRSRLGPEPELEEWTASWARLHERWDMPTLDEPLAERAAARLVAYVGVLQPLVDELRPLVPDASTVLAARRTHRMEEVPPDFGG
jgi:hypothetical protein